MPPAYISSSEKVYVMFATGIIKITTANLNGVEFRAVLNFNSQVNLVSEQVIKKLGVSTSTASLLVDCVENVKQRVTKKAKFKV